MISLQKKKIIIINKPEKVSIWNSYEKKPSSGFVTHRKMQYLQKKREILLSE